MISLTRVPSFKSSNMSTQSIVTAETRKVKFECFQARVFGEPFVGEQQGVSDLLREMKN